MGTTQVTDSYVIYIGQELEVILRDKDFVGKLDVEINIKQGAISNMNIAARKSVKLQFNGIRNKRPVLTD